MTALSQPERAAIEASIAWRKSVIQGREHVVYSEAELAGGDGRYAVAHLAGQRAELEACIEIADTNPWHEIQVKLRARIAEIRGVE